MAEQNSTWHTPLCSDLHSLWKIKTGHDVGSQSTLACQIFHGCSRWNEHLGFACSLSQAGNEIAHFLKNGNQMLDEVMFAKLLIIQLDELVDSMKTISSIAGLPKLSAPKELSCWANLWAKHRVLVMLQHHPFEVLSDLANAEFFELISKGDTVPVEDARTNKSLHYRVVTSENIHLLNARTGDYAWVEAETWVPVMLVIPPLSRLLEQACVAYANFVQNCLSHPDKVRAFKVDKCSMLQYSC